MIQIVTPENNATVSLLTSTQKRFIEDTHLRETAQAEAFDYLNLIATKENKTDPQPVVFVWKSETDAEAFLLEISTYKDFSEKIEYRTSATKLEVYNLLAGQKYYFRVSSAKECSATSAFITEMATPRCLHIPNLINVRDAGGWQTASGKRIRQGLLYRGTKLEPNAKFTPPYATDEGKEILANQLKIKTDLDLRFDGVGVRFSSELDQYGVKYLLLPCNAYEEFFFDKCADGNRKIFEAFADENNYPIYMHCWGGADRTAMVMFFLGSILGMSEADMLLDYEFTSLAVWGVRSRNGEGIQNFMKELTKYGADSSNWQDNALAYLHSIGVTDEVMEKIREIFL